MDRHAEASEAPKRGRRGFLALGSVVAGLCAHRASAQCVEPEEVHEVRGLVRIAHEAVPGVMSAMTMAFAPCPSVDTTTLSVGDEVRFRFRRGPGGNFLLLSLVRLAASR